MGVAGGRVAVAVGGTGVEVGATVAVGGIGVAVWVGGGGAEHAINKATNMGNINFVTACTMMILSLPIGNAFQTITK